MMMMNTAPKNIQLSAVMTISKKEKKKNRPAKTYK